MRSTRGPSSGSCELRRAAQHAAGGRRGSPSRRRWRCRHVRAPRADDVRGARGGRSRRSRAAGRAARGVPGGRHRPRRFGRSTRRARRDPVGGGAARRHPRSARRDPAGSGDALPRRATPRGLRHEGRQVERWSRSAPTAANRGPTSRTLSRPSRRHSTQGWRRSRSTSGSPPTACRSSSTTRRRRGSGAIHWR